MILLIKMERYEINISINATLIVLIYQTMI